ncbi:MAG: hypothetical protein ABEK36_01515 [Candidatus Aenigmatarchaeota archaeon]
MKISKRKQWKFQVLNALTDKGMLTIDELCSHLILKRKDIISTLSTLLHNHDLRRLNDKGDVNRYTITKKGRKKLHYFQQKYSAITMYDLSKKIDYVLKIRK